MGGKETALQDAAKHGNLDDVNKLLSAPQMINLDAVVPDSEDRALHYAAALEDSQILHLLLLAGADPNKPNADGQRPLSIALKAGRVANAVILISFGARLSLSDLQAVDPVHHATRQTPVEKRDQMVSILPRRFALVESRSPSMVLKRNIPRFIRPNGTIDLVSGIDWAARKGNHLVFHYLLDIKPELIHEPGKNMRLPLHRAVETGQLDLVKSLLDWGADKNAGKADGLTPLHLAAKHGNGEIVDLLLSAGADKNARSLKHRTPAQLALRAGYRAIAERIEPGMRRRQTRQPSASDGDSDSSSEEQGNAAADGILMGAKYK